MTERKTVAGAYEKIAEHELDCAKRYGELNLAIGKLTDHSESIKLGLRWIIGGVAGIVIAIIGWLAVTVYDLNREAAQAHANIRPTAASAVASVRDVSRQDT